MPWYKYCEVSHVHWQWMGFFTDLFHVVVSLDFSEAHWHAICVVLCTSLDRISSSCCDGIISYRTFGSQIIVFMCVRINRDAMHVRLCNANDESCGLFHPTPSVRIICLQRFYGQRKKREFHTFAQREV